MSDQAKNYLDKRLDQVVQNTRNVDQLLNAAQQFIYRLGVAEQDLNKIEEEINNLKEKDDSPLAPVTPVAPIDLDPILQRLTSLEQAVKLIQPPNLNPLLQRLNVLESGFSTLLADVDKIKKDKK